MKCGREGTKRKATMYRPAARGFSMLELVVVMAVALIMAGIAVPTLQRGLAGYRLQSATATVTGGIQATRYQAIFHGLQYQIAFSAANKTYQVSGQSAVNGAFASVGGPIPLGATGLALSADTTLLFHPSGAVSATSGGAALSPITMTLTYQGNSKTIQVSTYGNITVP